MYGSELSTSDCYGRYALLNGHRLSTTTHAGLSAADRRIISQNVRGFSKSTRLLWMSAWRKTPVRQRPLAWCIQETHVATVEEANTLRLEWRRIWGQDCDTDQVPMSYWSYGSSRSSGVAILLTPQAALHAAAWNEDRWNTRAIGISVHDMYILNVYAPNDRPERESLFDSLHDWNLPSGTSVLWRF